MSLKAWGLIVAPLYIAAIVAANILTAHEPPLVFDWLGQTWVVTWGTFLIAATFFLRDGVQIAFGRATAYAMVGLALVVSVVLSRYYGDLLWVTIGSAAALAVSETLDTEVFTRLRGSISKRVAVSGVVGGTLDSIVFAVIGLSPLTTGIVPWEFLWTTVVAQVVVKCAANVLVAIPVRALEPEPA